MTTLLSFYEVLLLAGLVPAFAGLARMAYGGSVE